MVLTTSDYPATWAVTDDAWRSRAAPALPAGAVWFVAARATRVDLIERRANLGKDMSPYLVEPIRAHHAMRVHADTTCTALRGDRALHGVTVTSSTDRDVESSDLGVGEGARAVKSVHRILVLS